MRKIISLIIFVTLSNGLLAQYTVNGDARQISCNEYKLTNAANGQSGSVWNNNKIDLSQSFDFKFDVILSYPGPNDGGADGIVFVLQPISTSVGSSGGGLGYQGVSPAVGVTIDTYSNTNDNDPTYDHIAIQLNGDLNHNTANNIAGPVQAIGNSNIEDGTWHAMRITWDVASKTLTVYMDGLVRVSAVKDFVTDVFAGNPLVYWGFTGSTGGLNNEQRFRIALNPSFHFGPAQKRCINEPIQFFDSTVSFTPIAKFYWDFGDGSPIDSINLNPIHTFAAAGNYTVLQKVIGADGCEANNIQTVRVGSKPVANFTYNNNCVSNPSSLVFFYDSSIISVGTLNTSYWDLGNGQTASGINATTSYPAPGDKMIKHVVTTIEGCESDTLYKIAHMYVPPVVDFTFTDSVCLGKPTLFFGSISNALGDSGVLAWNWNIADTISGVFLNVQNPIYTYLSPGNHAVFIAAVHPNYHASLGNFNSNACFGFVIKNVFVVNKPTAHFTNNTICQSVQTLFTDSSYSSDNVPINQWWWQANGGITSTQNTITTTYTNAGIDTVKLVVQNSKGCLSDTLKQPIVINAKPVANFGYSNPVCYGLPVQFTDSSVAAGSTVNKWLWVFNNASFSTQQNTSLSFTLFNPQIGLVATSAIGCKSDTVFKTLFVNPVPNVIMSFKNACKNTPVNFTATDNSATVTQWKWQFGDGSIANTKDAQHTYTANGTYKVKLYATTASGCYSDSLQKDITIYGTNVFAGNDTIAAAGQAVQLQAIGGLSYLWTPSANLSNANIANPVVILTATQKFTVKAFTPEGCESYDDVTVNIYKGPDIYLPNAFTPNGDGLNDIFKGIPVGIKQFNYLKIYNRWGQLVFATTDYRKGWDGMWQAQKQVSGSYIVLVNGVDFNGNIIAKQQSLILLR
jgi:gliding motility-associated-like protein